MTTSKKVTVETTNVKTETTFVELSPVQIAELSPVKMSEYFATLQAQIDATVAENKKYGRGSYQRHLNKFDFVLLQILNAGINGITVSELIKVGKGFIDAKGKISAVNVKTIHKDFNTKNTVFQRGMLYLNNPQQFDETSKRPSVECVIMAQTNVAHPSSLCAKHKYTNDNKLTFISGAENVKEYLLQRGATNEMFKQ
jgi:hypothetical protein